MTHGLTPRQTEIAALLVEGLTQQGIADRLGISLSTVKGHLYGNVKSGGRCVLGLYERIGVGTKVEAAEWAYHHGKGLTITHFLNRRHRGPE